VNEHVGENAELGALGLLDAAQRADLELHVASCPECLRKVGAAEEAAAHLASVLPRAEPSAALGERLRRSVAEVDATRVVLPGEPVGIGLGREALGIGPAGGGRVQRTAGRLAAERTRSGRLAARAYLAAALIVALLVGLSYSLLTGAEREATLRGDELALAEVLHSHFNHVTMTGTADLAPTAKILYAKDGSWLYVLVEGQAGRLHVVTGGRGSLRDLGTTLQRGALATLFVRNAGKPEQVMLRDGPATVATATLTY
jgi:hypothetical protein